MASSPGDMAGHDGGRLGRGALELRGETRKKTRFQRNRQGFLQHWLLLRMQLRRRQGGGSKSVRRARKHTYFREDLLLGSAEVPSYNEAILLLGLPGFRHPEGQGPKDLQGQEDGGGASGSRARGAGKAHKLGQAKDPSKQMATCSLRILMSSLLTPPSGFSITRRFSNSLRSCCSSAQARTS